MNAHRRRLLKLLPASGLAMLSGCGESDEEKIASVQRAIEQQQAEALKKPLQPVAEQLTPEEKAARDPSRKLVLHCAANLADPFQKLQASLMQAAMPQIGGCRFKVMDGAGDPALQVGQLNEAAAQHPLFVIVSPLETHLTTGIMESMRNAGSVVIGLDERFGVGACTAVAFVDQKKLGRMAGELVVDALRRKAKDENQPHVSGRVVHLQGDTTSFSTKARSEGFREALKAEPGAIIVHEAPGGWSAEGGKARTEEALRLQHEFDVVFAHNDAMAAGASAALTTAQMRERVLIVGIDGGLELVRNGTIDATLRQPMPMETAFDLIKRFVADKHFNPPPRTELEPEAVTPVNLDAVQARVMKAGG